jgi:hypothetical protein
LVLDASIFELVLGVPIRRMAARIGVRLWASGPTNRRKNTRNLWNN